MESGWPPCRYHTKDRQRNGAHFQSLPRHPRQLHESKSPIPCRFVHFASNQKSVDEASLGGNHLPILSWGELSAAPDWGGVMRDRGTLPKNGRIAITRSRHGYSQSLTASSTGILDGKFRIA